MEKILIGGPARNQVPQLTEMLRSFEVIQPDGRNELSRGELEHFLPQCHAFVAGEEIVDDALLSKCPNLRVISRLGTGYDKIDVQAAIRRRVAVCVTRGVNAQSVAEHAFALILAMAKRITANHDEVKNGRWGRTVALPLRQRVLGIVGFGKVGEAVARIAAGFQMKVIAFSPSLLTGGRANHNVEAGDLDKVCQESDYLCCAIPLTPQTQGMFDLRRFSTMKRSAYFINIARGGVVVEDDMVAALKNGIIAGAALDVLTHEPPSPDSPILKLDNVVFSPHIGGLDQSSLEAMTGSACESILSIRDGHWPIAKVIAADAYLQWTWANSGNDAKSTATLT